MVRTALKHKGLWVLVLVTAVTCAAYAGEHCTGHAAATADAANGQTGSHCKLVKGVSKDVKLTDDGAIVTLVGKNADATRHIQEHLQAHAKGESCPDCPLSMKGVTTKVEMSKKGGTITITASDPDALKAVREWANRPAGACCGKMDQGKKA